MPNDIGTRNPLDLRQSEQPLVQRFVVQSTKRIFGHVFPLFRDQLTTGFSTTLAPPPIADPDHRLAPPHVWCRSKAAFDCVRMAATPRAILQTHRPQAAPVLRTR